MIPFPLQEGVQLRFRFVNAVKVVRNLYCQWDKLFCLCLGPTLPFEFGKSRYICGVGAYTDDC